MGKARPLTRWKAETDKTLHGYVVTELPEKHRQGLGGVYGKTYVASYKDLSLIQL